VHSLLSLPEWSMVCLLRCKPPVSRCAAAAAAAQARELLQSVGGVLQHAFLAEDGRVSYRPYR
jgi:hypothetical protein